MGPWHEADEIDVWGLDTWGSVCTCERCRALGNGTDQMLHMASHFRSFLDRARAAGRLDHDVKMALIAYEGTSTLAPPERPIPQNLLDAGDYLIYAPIVRCYAHGFDDPGCSYNRAYASALSGWNQIRPHLPVMVLEYYNVSKFEDLPLLFTHSMAHDFQVYRRTGAAGFVYMHVPLVNWGMRALTQVLLQNWRGTRTPISRRSKRNFFRAGTVHTRDGSGLYTIRSTWPRSRLQAGGRGRTEAC